MGRLWQRLDDWAGLRIGRQFVLRSLAGAFAGTGLVALLSLVATVWLLQSQWREGNLRQAEAIENQVAIRLGDVVRGIAELATTPMVATALVDSFGRDSYLIPFLRGYRLPAVAAGSLALCDFNGIVLTGDGSGGKSCHADRPEFGRAMAGGVATAFLVGAAADPDIVLIQPVIYAHTRQAEGAIVATLSGHGLLEGFAALVGGSQVTIDAGIAATEPTPWTALAVRSVAVPVEGGPQLRLTVARPFDLLALVVPWLMGYLLVAGVVMALVTRWMVSYGRTLTQPIADITAAAKRIADQGALAEVASVSRRDEIGELASALNRMIAALRYSRAGLEDEVQRQTHELSVALENLNHSQALAHVGSWYLDLAALHVTWSDEIYRICGLPVGAAMTPERFLALVHPDDRDAVIAAWLAISTGGTPYQMEHRIVVADRVKWVRQWAQVVLDANGRPLRAVGSVQDISHRHEADTFRRLAASVFAETHEGILVVDAAGIIVDVNRAFADITGYGRDEAVGQTPALLHSGRQDQAFYAEMWRQIVEQGRWCGQLWDRRKDGSLFAERLSISAVKNERGEVTHYVGVFSVVAPSEAHN